MELSRVLTAMSGRPCVVLKEPFAGGGPGIYVGDTLMARRVLPDLVRSPSPEEAAVFRAPFDPRPPRSFAPLPPERWDDVAWVVSGGRIVIAGGDAGATKLAVYRFLQKECGVRWWVPGVLGEDVPQVEAMLAPEGRTVEKPSFVSRAMSGLRGADGLRWLSHNLLRSHVSMNHSLPGILDASVARTHPGWFPSFDGKPFDADRWNGPIPHPVFTNAEVADYVASKAIEYFDAHPDASSFSISPGDTSLFGDLDAYAGLVDPQASFRGRADLSNAVFTFDNAVAGKVAEWYPGRFLGALAYSLYENVPDFPVAPNIIPFLTADRSQWYDPQFRKEDLALARKWAAAGPKLIGTWDYYYGYPYLVPRVMMDEVCESIPALRDSGVSVFYCELYPIWGFDAPKAWMAAQLLWDSGRSEQDLKREFFDGYFGPAFAHMRSFFERCDSVWMAQPGQARWIKYYGDADQAMLFPPDDVAALRSMIDEAMSMDLPGKYRARVELVSDAFRYTERICRAWPALQRVARWTPAQPPQELEDAIPGYLAARADMASLNVTCAGGDGLNKLRRSLGYLEDDDPLAGRLALLRSSLDAAGRAAVADLAPDYAELITHRAVPLIRTPFAKGLDDWQVTHWPNPELDYTLVGEGPKRALRVAGANIFCVQTVYRVRPGIAYVASIGADGRVSASSTVRLLLEFLDDNAKVLAFHADRLPCGELENALLASAGTAPLGASYVRLTIITSFQSRDDVISFHVL
jgi:hypothetical protein